MNKEMDCKHCHIYKVQDYIINNLKTYNITSKCGACIITFSLRYLLKSCDYADPRTKRNYEELEEFFNNWRDRYNE